MRYLADLLTLTRFILSIILWILAFIGSPAENAFIIFLTAELTDTFDGTCARKWPFPKDKTPKYRKYAAQFDMVSDVLLAAGQVLYCTLQVNWIVGLVVIAYYTIVCGILELVLYGKLFGHPDNCTKNSLTARNFPLAKKLVLARRYLYTICLGVVNAFILFATNWPDPVKYGLFVFGCSIFVFIWFFLRQRRKHVSRDAVDIERKLTKEAKKSTATKPTSKK
ncbi:CDP-alcohol phosphatidyltransferase family protein [Candidatus Saccharibacteria bacterium]|nr:CDP-alcohol phosphatidyltransferase family protein [Candidatus Saccharibacteria bacterium]